jgi:hypothetical protein
MLLIGTTGLLAEISVFGIAKNESSALARRCKESFIPFSYYFSYSLATSHMYVDHLILSTLITNPLPARSKPTC